jgi:hypothetical protein
VPQPRLRPAGGTLRTLRHGQPEQVVADLRDFYRARTPPAPVVLGPMARRRPGEVMAARNRIQFAAGSTAPGVPNRRSARSSPPAAPASTVTRSRRRSAAHSTSRSGP